MRKKMSVLRFKKPVTAVVLAMALFQIVGCGPAHVAKPEQLTSPQAIQDNSGEYLSPITRDKTLAEWSDKMAHVALGASLGSTIGSMVGQQVFKQIPIVGGIFGDMAGRAVGRRIAISNAGGMDFIKKTSDLSFASLNDLSMYLYVEYYNGDHYAEAVKAAMELYPDLKKSYLQTIVSASQDICRTGACPTINETICAKGPCR